MDWPLPAAQKSHFLAQLLEVALQCRDRARKTLTMLVVATAISTSVWSAAQEGQVGDKLTGTVRSVDSKALVVQIETADKKIVKFSVNGNTKIAHGDLAAALDEVKAGAKVVVTMEHGKTPNVAVAIELAELPKP